MRCTICCPEIREGAWDIWNNKCASTEAQCNGDDNGAVEADKAFKHLYLAKMIDFESKLTYVGTIKEKVGQTVPESQFGRGTGYYFQTNPTVQLNSSTYTQKVFPSGSHVLILGKDNSALDHPPDVGFFNCRRNDDIPTQVWQCGAR